MVVNYSVNFINSDQFIGGRFIYRLPSATWPLEQCLQTSHSQVTLKNGIHNLSTTYFSTNCYGPLR